MIKLEAQNLSVERANKNVVDNISFAVNQGEIFGLLGGNGAGKSTTLLAFLGFLPITNGVATVDGISVVKDPAVVRRSVAYLPEAANLYSHLSAYENIDYLLTLAGASQAKPQIDTVLDQVSLADEARSRHLSSYSKGMRQKVAIAVAMLREAPILLLDEPTSGLDPSAIDEFGDLMSALAKAGTTILMGTHDVYGACHIANRIGLLRDGSLAGMFEAPASGQISPDQVHRAFTQGA